MAPEPEENPIAARAAALSRAARLMRRATYFSVTLAGVLVTVKTAAWLMTGSVTVLSSLLDSLLDMAASLVNLVAIRTAVAPADREHRFGHGKAEPLAGLGQSAFIAGSALFLFIEAAHRLIEPQPIEHSLLGIAVMLFSIASTLLLIRYQRRVIARTRSLAIGADELHYRGDLILNIGVIFSLIAAGIFRWQYIDPIFGTAIGIWILYSAWQISRKALVQLMDHEFPDADRARIREIALEHGEVVAVHDLRTRAAGHTAFIQLHLEMEPEMTLRRAHEVADAVEARINAVFPHAEILIHQDPAGIDEPRIVFPPSKAAR